MHVELGTRSRGKAEPAEVPDASMPPAEWPNSDCSRMVMADGRRWHVQETGRGETLLLIHGTGASTHSFRSLLPLLARHYRVMAVDLPGHGFTGRHRNERLSLDVMSNAVTGLLSQESFKPQFIVGHSAGAAIALRMSLDGGVSPVAVVGLNAALLPFGGAWRGLISPVTRLIAASGMTARLISAMARDRGSIRRMVSSTGSHLDDEGASLYRALFLRPGHVAAVLSMMANWELGSLLDELRAFRPRLTLVAGERDLAVPPAQIYRVAEYCADIDVVNIADGGHLVHEEQPHRIADIVDEALCPNRAASTEFSGES